MAVFTTQPIENNPVNGIRQTQQVTITVVNRDSVNASTITIFGYHLSGIRSLYVLEEILLAPNEVATRKHFADFDAFEFVFTTSNLETESTDISVWRTNGSGELISSQRLVSNDDFITL